jgi:hypothetical protein
MTDIFDNKTAHIHGHATDSGSMPMSVGSDTKHVMPLFLQRKNGIPEVTNWDDSINSVSKTDKAYFVDQQANNCGQPKDIVIKDDICVVGYPHHTATIKSSIDVSSVAKQTYSQEPANAVCYNDGILFEDQDDQSYNLMFGIMLDYSLDTPEINEETVDSEDPEYHTYFYDTYLKIEYNGETTYHSFGGFITSSEYGMIYQNRTNCEANNTWLDGPSNNWYYIKDTGKIAVSVELFDFVEAELVRLNESYPVYYDTPYSSSGNEDGCTICNDDPLVKLCYTCAVTNRFFSINKNVTASLIKLTQFEDCGKIDVYYKKSGKIEAYNNNEITSTDHDLSDYDILKISGEFGEGNVISDINGIVYVKVVDSNTFTIFSDPRTDEAGSVEDFSIAPGTIDNLTSLEWTCIGNSEQSSYQSWNYYGSYQALIMVATTVTRPLTM